MNIFVLDYDPAAAAQQQCDQHVRKMCMEATQLLYFAFPEEYWLGASTHLNHPCSLWARASGDNFAWLLEHAKALFREYARRYGKDHAYHDHVRHLRVPSRLTASGRTPFAQCMPPEYQRPCAVAAYRAYYAGDKVRFARWKHGNEPSWWPGRTPRQLAAWMKKHDPSPTELVNQLRRVNLLADAGTPALRLVEKLLDEFVLRGTEPSVRDTSRAREAFLLCA